LMAHQLGDLNDVHTGKTRPKGVRQIVKG